MINDLVTTPPLESCSNCRHYKYIAHDLICDNPKSNYFSATVSYEFHCNFFEEIQDINEED